MSDDSVAWSDAFSVGFEAIDNQHKKLVKIANELFDGCKSGMTAGDVKFLAILREAAEYAQTHFADEEKYMRQANFPDLDAHRKIHREFTNQVIKAIQTFETGGVQPIDLARFLKDWLLNHIAKMDKEYAPYLAKL
jgi:hemerythrin-like metal-binding protein